MAETWVATGAVIVTASGVETKVNPGDVALGVKLMFVVPPVAFVVKFAVKRGVADPMNVPPKFTHAMVA